MTPTETGAPSSRAERIEFLSTAGKEYIEQQKKQLEKSLEFGEKLLQGRMGSDGLASLSLDLSLDSVVKGIENFVKGAIST